MDRTFTRFQSQGPCEFHHLDGAKNMDTGITVHLPKTGFLIWKERSIDARPGYRTLLESLTLLACFLNIGRVRLLPQTRSSWWTELMSMHG